MPTALLLLSACAVLTVATTGRSHPEHEGSVEAKGLASPATIARDFQGIPHIRAASEADAFYALGFAHGQDRLFQMDLNRRLVQGRLAPWLGERSVELDAFMASMRIADRAEEAVRGLDPDKRFLLAAYAAGVNGAAAAARALPVEERLLLADWEEWTAVDTVSLAWLHGLGLITTLGAEVFAFELREKLAPEDVDALLRYDDAMPPVDAFWKDLRRVQAGGWTPGFEAFFDLYTGLAASQAEASNTWVVAGSRSEDGKPILANDPHLGAMAPGFWYAAELQGGGLHLAGATVPGIPGVLSGHNGKVAWGVTNAMADTVDLAVVQRNGERGYVLAGENLELETRTIPLTVKDVGDVTREVLWTRIGPVVSALEGKHLVVLRWNGLEVVDQSIAVLFGLARAATAEDALEVAGLPTVNVLHMAFADDLGTVGTVITGASPQRTGFTGMLPHPAWDARYTWGGTVPAPLVNASPESGMAISANHRPEWLSEGERDALGTRYVSPFRYRRIQELLEATPLHSVASFQAIQTDTRDLRAALVVPRLLATGEPTTESGRLCHQVLSKWDFTVQVDDGAPLVFAQLERSLLHQALDDDLGVEGTERYLQAISPGRTVLDGSGRDRYLYDPDVEVRKALQQACDALIARYGSDPTRWSWTDVHTVTFAHPFTGPDTLTGFSPSVDVGPWTSDTVAAGGWRLAGDDFSTTWVSSMRIVVPLGNPGAARIVVPPGQVGTPGHRHYRDLLNPWAQGELFPLWYHDADVAREADEVLELVPSP